MLLSINDDTKCKADVWKKFRLIKIKDTNEVVFGWTACKDCLVCIKFKVKQADGSVNFMELKILWIIAKLALPKLVINLQ